MRNWSNVILYFLLACYCLFVTELIDKYWFSHELFGSRLGLIMGIVFMSAYPVFGWRRNPAQGFWARLSFKVWTLLGISVGVVAIGIDAFSNLVVHHFSP